MRYYIADCHFYHKNLLTEMDNRDFESVEQMNEVMIEKWNKKVHAQDEVVILGDLSLGNGKETNEILCRLKGRLYLIRGNHDERYLRDKDFDVSRFEWVRDYAEIHDNKRKIVLMHYPVFCYNGQFRRGADGTPLTYMLHGHIHSRGGRANARNRDRERPIFRYDVGLDANDYKPVSRDQILSFFRL